MPNSKIKGLGANSRSPGSIINAEHHDPSGSNKAISGEPISIDRIMADSTAGAVSDNALENHQVIRVYNANATAEFLWVGKEGSVPGTVDVTTGLALAPESSYTFYVGYSDDPKESLVVKSSSSLVQVVVMEK